MTRANRVSTDPIDVLVEIMQTIDRRVQQQTWSAEEAFVLGQVMGTASRVPLAVERYKRLAESDD